MYPNSSNFQFKEWYIEAVKGPILASKGDIREKYERDINLPHLPDMLFANNHLKLTHKKGFGIHFKGIIKKILNIPKILINLIEFEFDMFVQIN